MRLHSPAQVPAAGFTLIEVMITVAIVAILAAVALPAYFDYITRSKIVEAKTNLSDMRTRFEQYFLDNRKYPGCAEYATGSPPAGKIFKPGNAKFFTIGCDTTDTSYTVTATGKAKSGVDGFIYTINEKNEQATTNAWGKSSTTCWVSRKNGDCS